MPLAVGYPYIIRIWSEQGYIKGAALQVFTIMYALGYVVVPLITDSFLITLPDDIDKQACEEIDSNVASLTSNTSRANNASDYVIHYTHDVMLTTTPLIMTSMFSNTSTSVYRNLELARWAFAIVSGGAMIPVGILAVVCLMFKVTYSSEENSSVDKDNKPIASFVLVCVIFATLYFWASVLGSLVLVLQTYAIVGLSWDKSDASKLNAICAAGQVNTCAVCIQLSGLKHWNYLPYHINILS